MKKIGIKIMVMILSVISVIGVNTNEAFAEWENTTLGWKYSYGGDYHKGWLRINGTWYCFDENGIMRTGWIQDGFKWYYCYADGSMANNTVIDGYELGSDGAWVDSNKYPPNPEGELVYSNGNLKIYKSFYRIDVWQYDGDIWMHSVINPEDYPSNPFMTEYLHFYNFDDSNSCIIVSASSSTYFWNTKGVAIYQVDLNVNPDCNIGKDTVPNTTVNFTGKDMSEPEPIVYGINK